MFCFRNLSDDVSLADVSLAVGDPHKDSTVNPHVRNLFSGNDDDLLFLDFPSVASPTSCHPSVPLVEKSAIPDGDGTIIASTSQECIQR